MTSILFDPGEVIGREACLKAEASFQREIPPLFRETDPKHPDLDAKAWERVQDWQYDGGPEWLYCFGETGTGKSRSVFWRMKHLAREGNSILIMSGSALKEAVVDRLMDRPSRHIPSHQKRDKFFGLLESVNVLWIDEIDKCNYSKAFKDAFFTMLNHRHEWKEMTILTGRFDPEAFVLNEIGQHDGDQVFRRIAQSATIVGFRRPQG